MLTDGDMCLALARGDNREVMDVSKVRLMNVRTLIEEAGGQSEFADKVDRDASYISQIAGKNPTKPIGPRISRHIESCFGRPMGWLDARHDLAPAAPGIDDVLLSQCMDAVRDTVRAMGVTISAKKESKIVAMIYKDAVEGKLPDQQTKEMARLIDLAT